jgi:subtilisin family serine protease
MRGNRTEGKDGVSLRFPRPVIVTAAIGLAVAWTALGSVPALADQVRQGEWWLGALHVTQAQKTTQGAGVTIALLDTGVDPKQADIAGSVITGPDYTGSGEKLGSEFFGIHGTAMASLIVGHGHGAGHADGILGVAPAAKLLSVPVTLDGGDPLLGDSGIVGSLPNAIAEGIRYAVSNGAQVIDLPLDPGQSPSDLVASTAPAPAAGTPLTADEAAAQAAAGGSSAEQSAVAYALSKGVVLVAPGGDDGTGTDDPNFPADYPGVISVGAFNSSFIKAPFTSHQSYVTLTAAGSGMTAAIPTGYTTVSSTSAASAIVTGIAALIKSQYPELTPAQVTTALTTSTVFRPANGLTDGSGHGTVDAARALAAAKNIARPGPHRAGAGAVSATQPATPPVPYIDQALAPKLERDGLISAALLAVLLIPVTAFAMVRLRRRQARQGARPEPEPAARTPYAAHNSDSQADQMLQYFAAAPAQPEGARATRSGNGSAQPVANRGSSYARGTGSFGGTFGDGGPPPPGEDGQRGSQFPRSPLGPARRANIRPPKVSGTPPWEPAPKPETELPWASSPPPLPRRAPMPMPAPPASTSGPVAGAGDSIWGAAERPRVPAVEASAAEGDAAAQPGIRPIYVWNPAANTETFPSVPSTGKTTDADAADEPPSDG